jgi:uncharacterized protein involved in exopolysaccharide biosynthesis
MTEAEWRDDEISIFAVGNTLLQNRWRIARWMIAAGAIAALMVFSREAVYRASASFISQGAAGGEGSSGLAGIAGQFGVSVRSGNPSVSPDFYSELLRSRTLLEGIVRDTFVVQELGGRGIAFLDLFEIQEGPANFREEAAVQLLTGLTNVSVLQQTGIVRVSVATPWPSASLALVTAFVSGVREFNQRTRQSQAAAERKFVERRLSVAADELRAVENRMQAFLQANRQIANSPELTFERDRIQREVSMRQQVFSSMTESYEAVRLREVRDTPVITLFEAPSIASVPEPRGRLKAGLLGVAIGAFIGVLLAFGSEVMARSRLAGSADADEFAGTLKEVKGEVLRLLGWVTGRGPR